LTHDDLLKYSVASQNAAEGKEDARRKPSKRVCALCSTTALPREDGYKTAYPATVFDLHKAQPAAATKAR
jgi:hypothetical protein